MQPFPVDELVLAGSREPERVLLGRVERMRHQHFTQKQVPVHRIAYDVGHLRVFELQKGVAF